MVHLLVISNDRSALSGSSHCVVVQGTCKPSEFLKYNRNVGNPFVRSSSEYDYFLRKNEQIIALCTIKGDEIGLLRWLDTMMTCDPVYIKVSWVSSHLD